jgi:peptidoglycan/LPS O-acetylase OafA/YrhL
LVVAKTDGSKPRTAAHFVGFDGLRLAAAVSVIFSHAFLLASGDETGEPLVRLLGPNNIMGLYGVFTFFIISGFLLTRSLAGNAAPLTYAVNRLLRILPGFAVCMLVTALVIGPLFSSVSPREYFATAGPFQYVRTTISTLADTTLQTVFGYDGPNAPIVNGSLWSLHYEALSYIFLLVVWLAVRTLSRTAAFVVILSLLVWTVPAVEGRLTSIEYTLPYFSAGVTMAWFHERFGTGSRGAALALIGLAIAAWFGWQAYAFAPLGGYLVVYVGERPNIGSRIANAIGDCSYGLYLYGWPAEQMIKQLTGTESPLMLFVTATPVALAFALASYHFIELPAMSSKRAVANAISAGWARLAGRRAATASVFSRVAFVATAAGILTTKSVWWFFMYSLGLILVSAVLGGLVGAAADAAASALGLRRRARGQPGSSPSSHDDVLNGPGPGEPGPPRPREIPAVSVRR